MWADRFWIEVQGRFAKPKALSLRLNRELVEHIPAITAGTNKSMVLIVPGEGFVERALIRLCPGVDQLHIDVLARQEHFVSLDV
jgi:hypothetical protein